MRPSVQILLYSERKISKTNNAVVHTKMNEERYVKSTQSIYKTTIHTSKVISALMNASICSGEALDYDTGEDR